MASVFLTSTTPPGEDRLSAEALSPVVDLPPVEIATVDEDALRAAAATEEEAGAEAASPAGDAPKAGAASSGEKRAAAKGTPPAKTMPVHQVLRPLGVTVAPRKLIRPRGVVWPKEMVWEGEPVRPRERAQNCFRLPHRNLHMRVIKTFDIFRDFSCCPPNAPSRDLDEFIQRDAETYFRNKIALTYGFFSDQAPNFPLAFAALQNDMIRISDAGEPTRDYPAVKILRFGVRWIMGRPDGSVQILHGKGLGTMFLTYIKYFLAYSDGRAGCRYLTLSTYDRPALIKFYQDNGFSFVSETSAVSPGEVLMYFDLTRFPPFNGV